MRLPHIFILPLLLLPLSGCFNKSNAPATAAAPAEQETVAQASAKELRYTALRQEAARIAAALDDRQLAAQVIISGIDGKGHLTRDMQILLTECPSGGIMLFRYNLDTDNDSIRSLLAETAALIQNGAAVPPFIAVDHEGGAINRFRPGVADLPAAASYYENIFEEITLDNIITDSFNAGIAMKRLGINLNLAPVAEHLHNDNRDFLDSRSYGPDPVFTAQAAAAFIAGMEQAGILCVAKHFPGSAGADPHLYASVLRGDKAALAELVSPFAALIRGGSAPALMVSHSVVPAWDGALIASLSPVIMGEWLRGELGFEGIIICDDFSMAAARGQAAASGQPPETAAVLSLAAGADMVLVWPPDLRRTHRAILAALANSAALADSVALANSVAFTDDANLLTRERLQEAAARIIFEKLRIGLIF